MKLKSDTICLCTLWVNKIKANKFGAFLEERIVFFNFNFKKNFQSVLSDSA